MFDYLLIFMGVLSLVFFLLGFFKEGLLWFGLAGLILLGSGLFIMGDGLDIKQGFDTSSPDQITYQYVNHSFDDFVEVKIISYSLIAIGLGLIVGMFNGLFRGG